MAQAGAVVEREFGGESEEDSAMVEHLFKEEWNFFEYPMYRGYDIAIDDSFDSGVASAIKRYNKHLKGIGKKVVLHHFRTGENILKINSVNGF
jgi:hypothetical protein